MPRPMSRAVLGAASLALSALISLPALDARADDPPPEGDAKPAPKQGDAPADAQPPPQDPAQPPKGDEKKPEGDVAPGGHDAQPNGSSKEGSVDAKGDDKAAPKPEDKKPKEHQGSFQFGSYGRVVAAIDGKAGPGRDADIVAHGSRLDEDTYVEAELRRDDLWEATGAQTHAVITLAIAAPVFHWNADFDIKMAVRNLYLQENDLGVKGLSVWAGSRMLRGDDIYVLDFWPLDNLNTLGAGVGYRKDFDRSGISGIFHVGASRPDAPFYHQTVIRPAPLDQFGTVPVEILDRTRIIGSLRADFDYRFSDPQKGAGPGIKFVAYGEAHGLPSGQVETKPKVFEDVPSDGGYVVGGEVSVYTGHRATYLNAFVRYASGLAAYGQFASPGQLAADKTTDGAHELLVAAGGNVEYGPIGVMLGTYVRSFRDASPALDYQDVDEGIILLRPSVFFGELAGLSLEGSYQFAQRGVVSQNPEDPTAAPNGPRVANLFRFGVVPFLSPAGKGDFTRPHIRFIYTLTARDNDAKNLYPDDDIFHRRDFEHFIGLGAEWWFNSSTYGS